MAALKRRGAMENAEVIALIEAKLEQAKTDARVSTMKAKKAVAAARLDSEMERKLTEVTDQRVADKVEIKRATALFVDKSSSMMQAIEVAKQLAALISAVITADFHVYAFDTAAFEIKAPIEAGARPAFSDWEQAFQLIKADGRTSIGCALAKMTKERVYAEQIVLVTDEGENTAPTFKEAWTDYRREMHVAPGVLIVKVGGAYAPFERGLREQGIEMTAYQFSGDSYALPNLLPLLALPSHAELVDRIMSYELPRRPDVKVKAAS